MVSTRGVKLKFFEGERVLCYEPDPTKAKVLYDSKVLDIVVNKDQRGRKSVEYLIHFQGWNSSWDRHVSEEFVLKDTPENRQLQRDLAKRSQLQIGAYLYRKERKKNRNISEAASASEDNGSSSSPARMNNNDGHGTSTSSEDDSSMEDEAIHIEITSNLKQLLEKDYYLIKDKKKLMKLPAEPNIVTILESYYRHYAVGQICGLSEKTTTRYRPPPVNQNLSKPKPEDIQKQLHVCREVLDGLRIYFDYTVNDLLLYNSEKNQIDTKVAMYDSWMIDIKNEVKIEENFNGANHNNLNNGHSLLQNGDSGKVNLRKRTLRSNRSDSNSQNNGNTSPSQNNHNNFMKPGSSSSSDTAACPLSKTLYWKLLPDYVYNIQPPPPCLVYGATHMTRLFVKLPELLMASSITEDKLIVLLRHIDSFIDFLNEHKEWYGEEHYINAS